MSNGFKPGQSGNPAGKPKGAISKRKRSVLDTVERLGIDPFEVLLLFAKGDWRALGYESEKFIVSQNDHGVYEKFTIDPSVRAKCAAEAIQYIVPKLKSVEHTRPNALEGMTPEQRLEAMKQAVAMLEGQIKKND